MVLTLAKNPNILSFTPVAKSSGGNDSNDMSLVGESPKKYDFGILSPALDAVLDDNDRISKSPINMERNLMDLSEDRDVDNARISHSTPKEGMPISKSPGLNFSDVSHKADSNVDIQRASPLKHQEYKSPLLNFILNTPSQKQIGSLLDESIRIHSKSAASIQKSISRLSMLEASPFYSTPDAKFKNSTVKSLDSLFKNTPPEILLDQNSTESRNSEDREVSLDNLQDKAGNIGNSPNPVDKMDPATMEIISSPVTKINKFKDLSEVEKEDERKINPHNLRDKAGNIGNSPNPVDKMDSAATEILISLPVTEINNFKRLSEVEKEDEREKNHHNLQNKVGNIGNFTNPVDMVDSAAMEIISLPVTEINKFKKKTNPRDLKDKSGKSGDTPIVTRDKDLEVSQKNVLEVFSRSPSRKEIQNDTSDDIIHSSVLENESSPNSSLLKYGLRSSSAKKRKKDEAKLGDRDHRKEICGTQKSPKRYKRSIRDSESLECQNERNHGKSGGNEMKHWTDSYSKILGDTEKILSLSCDKLKLHEIDLLEDILVRTQRSRTYEILQTQLQSQKMFDPHSSIQHKRVTETKLELQKILHEHLKLKLMRLKREELLKKVELLKSGIQEYQLLKSNILPERSISVEVNNGYQQLSDDIQEVDHGNIALQQAVETSERKITSLTKFFHTTCKIEGDPGCENTIQSVNDYLVKRIQGRFIRLDSQLWVIDSLENKNGHHNAVLNYLGFNSQRLNISEGPVSYLSSSNILNHTKMNKSFPDMDICTAFSFVLHGEATRKYNGPRSLAQETQTRNLLLGNLLDVAEELQQARMELRNLTQTSFHLQSAEQLDLQLCFFDFENGRKVILTLDMSCLKRGIYPSDIVPCFSAVGSQNSESEIRGAVHNLGAGFFRIIRLCRCISRVVRASAR